jgi:hypothetical protein
MALVRADAQFRRHWQRGYGNPRPFRLVLSQALVVPIMAVAVALGGCASTPLLPYTQGTPPLVLVPASMAGVQDKRGRFREILCQVLETRATALPDYRPCTDALVRVGTEPPGSGKPVELGQSDRHLFAVTVPGVGWDCFADWLDLEGSVPAHVRRFGYDMTMLKVDGLSSSGRNAQLIRDAIMQTPPPAPLPSLVLLGYSKGATDILEAVVDYPEIRGRIAAVVSIAGSVGGSPLANDVSESQLGLLTHWPDARCTAGDGGALESLRPATRKDWLARNPLPEEIPYYSLVTYPEPDRISSVLRSSYRKLSKVDARNDSQLLFYDQVIPGGALLGYLNADHWALAVPVSRSHKAIGATLVDHNDFPREALLEALLRFIEEQLAASPARQRE